MSVLREPVPLRSFTITRTEGGRCARPGCEEPPVTLVTVDTGQECRVCEAHWPGIVEAAYALTGTTCKTINKRSINHE